jgi:hypothetical protein
VACCSLTPPLSPLFVSLRYVKNGDLFYYIAVKTSVDMNPDDDREKRDLEDYTLKVRDRHAWKRKQAQSIRRRANKVDKESGGGGGNYARVGGDDHSGISLTEKVGSIASV